MKVAIKIDEHRLAGLDVPNQSKPKPLKRYRLRGDQVLGTCIGFGDPIAERSNSERIAKRKNAVACDFSHTGVSATHALLET